MSSKVLIDKKIYDAESHWDTYKDKATGYKTRYRRALKKIKKILSYIKLMY